MLNTDEGDKVEIKVKDNGPGGEESKIADVFNKRFTTKRKGHGIGLIICKRIVDAHQGSISYSYENGACFTIVLPVSSSQTEKDEAQKQTASVIS